MLAVYTGGLNPALFRVVLASPRNPLNIGAVARAMSNFGLTDLRLVDAYRVAVEEAKSATHAGEVLAGAREYGSLAEAVGDATLVVGTSSVEKREMQLPLYRLEDAARRIRRHGGQTALLFGSEKFGLSNEEMSYCHFLTRIPTREPHGSMNLGQAVAVTLYELVRDGGWKEVGGREQRAASTAEVDRLTGLLWEALGESGYVEERVAGSTELKLRRLVRRMGLGQRDAVQWQGMIRQILWKMRNR
ncbi:MAG: TrmJ/YjtD family RNA methyltransferase [Acidobacteriaceae bacterium]|nr:TrmJ/YjtD family RNA methyltransferase [Acidobacteriaceae bacterium]